MARIRIANRPGADGRPTELDSSSAISLLNSLLVAGVRIRHDCGGKAICGTCAVRVIEGGAGLSPVGSREAERLAAGARPTDFRLACQARAARDVEIEVDLD
jgi:CDP-4-dehydro-6-deoxyglucose reductase, E3